MATTDIHGISSTASQSGLAGLMARLRVARSRRAEYQRVYSELQQYSDRELADLGFHRSTIRDIAWQAAYSR
ncbi:DUF1127 domain-containing protein [Salipiger sp. PrR002]|uniref:DUF1127 domain-containing protein n=1 Tax=Salipiger sp. PrR002 TaxID=2706489 RepID=UPI001941B58C|nr:DUF1127 domain-containing protein [Salipiger sp. PrR002]